MKSRVIKEIFDDDQKRKVVFAEREDGSITFEEWHYSSEPNEECWIPSYRQVWSFCDSLEIAEREARGRISWMDQQE